MIEGVFGYGYGYGYGELFCINICLVAGRVRDSLGF